MAISRVAGLVDLTQSEMAQGIYHLIDTDPKFNAVPDSAQRGLTPLDHKWAVRIGGQAHHLICWE